jgi:hypothetical protein
MDQKIQSRRQLCHVTILQDYLRLVAQKKATVKVIGELHEDSNDERALNVKRPSHCQYTGERGEDCEYTIAFAGLRSIKATCAEQIAALTQTIEAIDSLLPQDVPAPKKA